VASVLHILVSIAGVSVILFSVVNNHSFTGPLVYIMIFIVVPLITAYGIWQRKIWGTIAGLLFFLPQCINYFGQNFSFKFMAPLSLGLTYNTSDKGSFIIVNIFAIGMITLLIILLITKKKG